MAIEEGDGDRRVSPALKLIAMSFRRFRALCIYALLLCTLRFIDTHLRLCHRRRRRFLFCNHDDR
jgi:hypothetical protein